MHAVAFFVCVGTSALVVSYVAGHPSIHQNSNRDRLSPHGSSNVDNGSNIRIDPSQQPESECENAKFDICLVVDESGSVTEPNFTKEKAFFASFVTKFDVGPQKTRFCLFEFATRSYQRLRLVDLSQKGQIVNAILRQPYRGSRTNIAEALDRTAVELGANSRPDAKKLVVIMTDARHNEDGDPVISANRLRAAGAEVFAIGITNKVDQATLLSIADGPSNVFRVNNFDMLVDRASEVARAICQRGKTADIASTRIETTTPFEITTTIEEQTTTTSVCSKAKSDIVILIDESVSVGAANYATALNFLANFVSTFDVDSGATRFAMVEFSDGANALFSLDTYKTSAEIQNAIKSSQYTGVATNLDAGLNEGINQMLKKRPDATSYFLIVTDGWHMVVGNPVGAATRAKDAGILIYAIGVATDSPLDHTMLETITSTPEFVSYPTSYSTLDTFLGTLQQAVCAAPPTTTELTTTTTELTTTTTEPTTTTTEVVTTSTACSNVKVDVVFLLDESASFSEAEFQQEKTFLTDFVSMFSVPDQARFALFEYITDLRPISFTLDTYKTTTEVVNDIKSRPFLGLNTSPTAADPQLLIKLFDAGRDELSSSVANGREPYILWITDGWRNVADPIPEATIIKQGGIKFFTVGITSRVDQTTLAAVSSGPDYTVQSTDFASLAQSLQRMQESFCKSNL